MFAIVTKIWIDCYCKSFNLLILKTPAEIAATTGSL